MIEDVLDSLKWETEDQDTAAAPWVLRSFLKPATEDEFWDRFDLLHNVFAGWEGKPTRFAPLGVPLIYELLADPRSQGRDVLLVTLATMIADDPSQVLLGYGADPLYRAAFGNLPNMAETVRALQKGIPLVAELACVGDDHVRARAIDFLSAIGSCEGVDDEMPLVVLEELARGEANPWLRADALLGLGIVARARRRVDVPDVIDAAFRHDSPLVRDIAYCARAYYELDHLSERILAGLVELAKRQDVVGRGIVEDPDGLFPFNRGHLAGIGISAIAGSMRLERSRGMAALFEVFAHRLHDGRWEPPVLKPIPISIMARLVNPMIVEAFADWQGLSPPALAEKTLDEDQRRLVAQIDRFLVWSCIPHLVLKGDLTRLRHVPERVETAREAPGGVWQRWLEQC